MKIIIPMAGTGQRFLDAGYAVPKPLIEVDGRPMIEHVLDLFPGEADLTFICNSRHLEQSRLGDVLRSLAPKSRVLAVPPHKKGPVYSVSMMAEDLPDDEEVIVNYCDFSKDWDYRDFLKQARAADGAISAYKGFHPHMLHKPQYAFLRCAGPRLLEIREKRPFTDAPMQEYASDGTYYFKKGAYVKKYFRELMAKGIQAEGEYYVSMVYNLMCADGLRTRVCGIDRMLQWGTPRDLEEYQKWSDHFADAARPRARMKPRPGSVNLIAMAGEGRRFREMGFTVPKPLLEVDGRPMVLQAERSLPSAEKTVFVGLARQLEGRTFEDDLARACPGSILLRLAQPTQGQSCTCEKGLEGVSPGAPLLIAACDSEVRWDLERYSSLLDDQAVDALVWTSRGQAASARNPHMYSWVRVDDSGRALEVSVKKPVSDDPYRDHVVLGAFSFRETGRFLEAALRMRTRGARTNGEFYVDGAINELIAAGLGVKVFEVRGHVSWGTPEELRTYEYWRDHFAGRAGWPSSASPAS